MGNLPEFIMNHLALVIIFLGLLSYLLYTEYQTQNSSTVVNPQQAVTLMNHDNAVVLDIRPQEPYQSGHIINAVNIAAEDIEKTEKYKKKNIILVCETGQKTQGLLNQLNKKGFEHVYSLKGGMTAWRQADLPSAS